MTIPTKHCPDKRGVRQDGVFPSPPIQKVAWENKRTGFTEIIPQGIDPGWDTNPGKTRFKNLLKSTTDKLNDYSAPLAAATIASLLKGVSFKQWYEEGKQGNFPVGRLSETDAKKISAKTQTVVLSQETLTKQKEHHPDLSLEEYELVQETIERGEMIQEDENNLTYLLKKEQGYTSIVKSTKTGEAIFLTSFRRLPSHQLERESEFRRLGKKKGQNKRD